MCCPNGSVEMATADDCRSEGLITAPLHCVCASAVVERREASAFAFGHSAQAKDNRGLRDIPQVLVFSALACSLCGSARTTILAASGIDSSTGHFECGSLQ